jgi:hypothetical protein
MVRIIKLKTRWEGHDIRGAILLKELLSVRSKTCVTVQFFEIPDYENSMQRTDKSSFTCAEFRIPYNTKHENHETNGFATNGIRLLAKQNIVGKSPF